MPSHGRDRPSSIPTPEGERKLSGKDSRRGALDEQRTMCANRPVSKGALSRRKPRPLHRGSPPRRRFQVRRLDYLSPSPAYTAPGVISTFVAPTERHHQQCHRKVTKLSKDIPLPVSKLNNASRSREVSGIAPMRTRAVGPQTKSIRARCRAFTAAFRPTNRTYQQLAFLPLSHRSSRSFRKCTRIPTGRCLI